MAVRLTPAADSVPVWTSYSCYAIVESVWSEVVFVRCVMKMDWQGAMLCHKILCKAWRICYCDLWKVTKGLWRTFPTQGTSVQIAQVFLEGREQVEDEPRAGRPSTSKMDDNVERVRSLVSSDRRLTLRMIISELNLNRFTVHQILIQDLDMPKVCAKMEAENLTTEQKANRRDVLIFSTALRGSQNSSVALSHVMN